MKRASLGYRPNHLSGREFLCIELHVVRDADVAHVAARTCRADRLLHRLGRPDALEHRVRADALGELPDALSVGRSV
ncbi:MAG TPA: hypothetical protein VI072_22740 [Polyangiaceae bacterium]